MQTSQEPAAVALHNVSKDFGQLSALKNINFSVQPGEIVALLGPNGAGKTTAISLMLGLRKPSSGTVTKFGNNPRQPSSRQNIAAYSTIYIRAQSL